MYQSFLADFPDFVFPQKAVNNIILKVANHI